MLHLDVIPNQIPGMHRFEHLQQTGKDPQHQYLRHDVITAHNAFQKAVYWCAAGFLANDKEVGGALRARDAAVQQEGRCYRNASVAGIKTVQFRKDDAFVFDLASLAHNGSA